MMRTFYPDFSYKVSYRQPPAALVSFFTHLSTFILHSYFRLILSLSSHIRKQHSALSYSRKWITIFRMSAINAPVNLLDLTPVQLKDFVKTPR